MKRVVPVLIGVLLVAALVAQTRWASLSSPHALASSKSPIAPSASEPKRILIEGRVTTYPGADVAVSTEVRGTITRLLVDEGQRVRKGQLIAELRADDLTASIREAQARVAETEADAHLYDVEVERAQKLWDAQVGTKQTLDRSSRDRDSAYARRDTAKATVQRMQAEIAKTRIYAPLDGVVVARSAQPGETVSPGTNLVTIANLDKVRIEAELDEFDIGRVQLGTPAVVTAEGFANQQWKGQVEEIPDAVVPRRLKPQDPGRPQDTRVLVLKVGLASKTPLKLGQRVEIELEAK
jgi:HlyD family secretion protein